MAGRRLLWLLLVFPTLEGCSLLGLAVGAGVPKYQSVGAGNLKAGDSVVLTVTEAHASSAVQGRFVARRTGEPDATHSLQQERPPDTNLVLSTRPSRIEPRAGVAARRRVTVEREIPLRTVTRVEKLTGSYWLTGLAIGGAVDFVLIGLTLLCVSHAICSEDKPASMEPM